MKKLFLILAAFSTLVANSQTKELDNLNKRLAKSDEAISDSKKSGSANVWLEHSDVLMSASNVYTKDLIADFSIEQTLSLIGKESSEIVEVEIMGVKYKQYVFENFDIYADANGVVMFWNTKREFREDALDGSFDALKKAYEIDPSTFTSKGYFIGDKLINQFNTKGMNLYNLDKKAEAADLFSKVVEINTMLGNVDTVTMYNTGMAYNDAGMYDKALEYMKKAKDLGYDQQGDVDIFIAYIYGKQGNKEAAIETLESALLRYPTNNDLMNQIINLYIETERSTETIISILDKAKKLDPKNISLYMLEAELWDKIGNKDKAEELFLASTKVDSSNYIGYMNAGIIRLLKGEALIEEARKLDINDTKGYNALVEKSKPMVDGAIELLEQAHELNKTEPYIIRILKELYYHKNQTGDSKMEAKYKYYNDLYNSTQGE